MLIFNLTPSSANSDRAKETLNTVRLPAQNKTSSTKEFEYLILHAKNVLEKTDEIDNHINRILSAYILHSISRTVSRQKDLYDKNSFLLDLFRNILVVLSFLIVITITIKLFSKKTFQN